jgi:hypothetical protein
MQKMNNIVIRTEGLTKFYGLEVLFVDLPIC